jgi:hypothetical protein
MWWYIFQWISLVGYFLMICEASSEWNEYQIDENRKLANQQPKCVKWGNTFDVSLTSKNVARPCKLPDGRPICCAAIEDPPTSAAYKRYDFFAKPIGSNYQPGRRSRDRERDKDRDSCVLEKKYFSSNQELRDLAFAVEIGKISTDHTDERRLKALVNYVISNEVVKNSTIWLERIRYHMNAEGQTSGNSSAKMEDVADANPLDLEFLSRFEYKRICHGIEIERWVEWIEPVTITMRHPFAFGRCRPAIPLFNSDTPRTDRSNVDYVLLQSGRALYEQAFSQGKRVQYSSPSDSNPGTGQSRKSGKLNTPIKHYMFDAGTSTFDSSLFWFTCGFSQVRHCRLCL